MLPHQQFHIFNRNFVLQTYTKDVMQFWFSDIVIHDAQVAHKLSYVFCWNSIQNASTKNCWTNLIFGHADSQQILICTRP